MKRQKERRKESELKVAEKELRKRLKMPKYDSGKDDEYWVVAPQYREGNTVNNKAGVILNADRQSNTAIWRDATTGRKRRIELPKNYWMASNTPDMTFATVPSYSEVYPSEQHNSGLSRLHKKLYQVSNKYINEPIVGSYARFVDSWNNDTNPVKAIVNNPATLFAASDLLITKAGSVVKNIKNLAKIVKKDLNKASLQELGEYYEARPDLLTRLTKPNEIEALNRYKKIREDIIKPKYRAQLLKSGIEYTDDIERALSESPEIYMADMGPGLRIGGFTNGNRIILNSNGDQSVLGLVGRMAHETSHNMNMALAEKVKQLPTKTVLINPNLSISQNMQQMLKSGKTSEEQMLLDNAYQFKPDIFTRLPNINLMSEKAAINADIVSRLADRWGITGRLFFDKLRVAPIDEIVGVSRKAGYANSITTNPEAMREALLKAAVYTTPATIVGVLEYDKGKDEPLRSLMYNRGKDIHIKPSKRGTFTAAAKKHGASVQEYARKVLKAPKGKYSAAMRRKANFARNASKWAH